MFRRCIKFLLLSIKENILYLFNIILNTKFGKEASAFISPYLILIINSYYYKEFVRILKISQQAYIMYKLLLNSWINSVLDAVENFIIDTFKKFIFNKYFVKAFNNIVAFYKKYLEMHVLFVVNKVLIPYLYLKKKFNDFEDMVDEKIITLIESKWIDTEDSEKLTSKEDYIQKVNKSPKYADIIMVLASRQRGKTYNANSSLWPMFLSLFLGLFIIIFICILHNQSMLVYVSKESFLAVIGSVICFSFWIVTFYKEKQMGLHTYEVRRNIRLGFYIFIFTEAMCFLALFWTFLHAFLAPSLFAGMHNPGEGIVNYIICETRNWHPYWDIFWYDFRGRLNTNSSTCTLGSYSVWDASLIVTAHINIFDSSKLPNPWRLPLYNTMILVSSALILNGAHTRVRASRYTRALISLSFVMLLGIIFLILQYHEIRDSNVHYSDGIYGACFYSLTGLHGAHVLIGVMALATCYVNFLKGNYSQRRHDTFWFAILYWHFVDVVWILVYFVLYCWPGLFFYWESVHWTWNDWNNYTFQVSKKMLKRGLFRHNKKLHFQILHELQYFSFTSISETIRIRSNFVKFMLDNDHLKENLFFNQDLILFFSENSMSKKKFGGILSNWYTHKFNLLYNDPEKVKFLKPLKTVALGFIGPLTEEQQAALDSEKKSKRKLPLHSLRFLRRYEDRGNVLAMFLNFEFLAFKKDPMFERNITRLVLYNELFVEFQYWNLNDVKRGSDDFAILMHLSHHIIFDEIGSREVYDFEHRWLQRFLIEFLKNFWERPVRWWCKGHAPYLVQRDGYWKNFPVPTKLELFEKKLRAGKI